MKQINQNVLKIKDPSTGEFKTIPNLTLDNTVDKINKVEVSNVEPADNYVDLWIDTSESNVNYKIPQIADDILSEEDTWSSAKIKMENDKVFDLIYPVGSIYMSVNAISPDNLFGGTWEQIQGRFLLGASSSYAAGSTGGEATHKLTINEMPSHRHEYKGYESSGSTTGWSASRASQKYNMLNDLQATGGGAAHNNMPPYLSVYIWKRTA